MNHTHLAASSDCCGKITSRYDLIVLCNLLPQCIQIKHSCMLLETKLVNNGHLIRMKNRRQIRFKTRIKLNHLLKENWWFTAEMKQVNIWQILTVYLSHFFSGSYGSQRLAGKMCLFFSYQLLSTTLPAWDFRQQTNKTWFITSTSWFSFVICTSLFYIS